jgi:alanine dehydrogenase
MAYSLQEGTLLLNQNDVKQVITMKEVVEICEKTFKGYGEGTTINPTKVNLDLGETASFPPYNGFMNAMPAYVGWLDSAGIKWAGGFLGERKRLGLPYITSLILLIDPRIGNFKAVMDGEHITNLRTGAQTAVALKYLHQKKSIRIGLFGAGMQGHTQTMAISEVFDIDELRVYDINTEASHRFADDMKDIVKGEIIVVNAPKEAAVGDAIICVTQSKDKFIKDEWIKPGMVLFPMGSYQECEDALILNADKIIVDHIEQTLHRGALSALYAVGKISEKDIYATLGEIVSGQKEVRLNGKDRILCVPIGTGAMDIAVATVVFQRAAEKGLGSRFRFV